MFPVQEVHIHVEVQNHIHVQAVPVILESLQEEAIILIEIPGRVIIIVAEAVAVVVIHAVVRLHLPGVIHPTEHLLVLMILEVVQEAVVTIQEVVAAVAIQEAAAVVVEAAIPVVAVAEVTHVVAVVVPEVAVVVVAVDDSLTSIRKLV